MYVWLKQIVAIICGTSWIALNLSSIYTYLYPWNVSLNIKRNSKDHLKSKQKTFQNNVYISPPTSTLQNVTYKLGNSIFNGGSLWLKTKKINTEYCLENQENIVILYYNSLWKLKIFYWSLEHLPLWIVCRCYWQHWSYLPWFTDHSRRIYITKFRYTLLPTVEQTVLMYRVLAYTHGTLDACSIYWCQLRHTNFTTL